LSTELPWARAMAGMARTPAAPAIKLRLCMVSSFLAASR
jgi:hypothetical protein